MGGQVSAKISRAEGMEVTCAPLFCCHVCVHAYVCAGADSFCAMYAPNHTLPYVLAISHAALAHTLAHTLACVHALTCISMHVQGHAWAADVRLAKHECGVCVRACVRTCLHACIHAYVRGVMAFLPSSSFRLTMRTLGSLTDLRPHWPCARPRRKAQTSQRGHTYSNSCTCTYASHTCVHICTYAPHPHTCMHVHLDACSHSYTQIHADVTTERVHTPTLTHVHTHRCTAVGDGRCGHCAPVYGWRRSQGASVRQHGS